QQALSIRRQMQQIHLHRRGIELWSKLLPSSGTGVRNGASVGLNRHDSDPYVAETSGSNVYCTDGRNEQRRIANRDVDGSHVRTLHRGISATATNDDQNGYDGK